MPNDGAAQPAHQTIRLRINLRVGAHRWIFSCAPHDVDILVARVNELQQDPDAPLDARTAATIRRLLTDEQTGSNSPQARSESADLLP